MSRTNQERLLNIKQQINQLLCLSKDNQSNYWKGNVKNVWFERANPQHQLKNLGGIRGQTRE